jgi:hypothetical protein
VLVIDDGAVVDRGPHDAVLARSDAHAAGAGMTSLLLPAVAKTTQAPLRSCAVADRCWPRPFACHSITADHRSGTA